MNRRGIEKAYVLIISGYYQFFFSVLILSLTLPIIVPAQGSLMVIPKRIVFEGKKRTHELNLANSGFDTVKYTITVVDMKMMEDGSFKEIKEPEQGQNFAGSHLRIFPKTITLGPNEAQTVKVQLINTNQMTPGEYRSHISFNVVPNENLKSPPLLKMVTNLRLKLVPIFAITIPAIVRIGENTTHVNFTDLSFEMEADSLPRVNVKFNRTGNMSAYGNISVEHTTPEGIETHVATLKGFSVYVPNSTRSLGIYLDKNVGVNYNSGKLRIIYTTLVEDRPVKMAEAELTIPDKGGGINQNQH